MVLDIFCCEKLAFGIQSVKDRLPNYVHFFFLALRAVYSSIGMGCFDNFRDHPV